jgi:hypothetical protein
MIVLRGATTASAQTPVKPPTITILFSGPGPEGRNTGPLGGIIIQGTAISAFTGQPVRHLWVADTFSSICRMDPELDAPGPWNECYDLHVQVRAGGLAVLWAANLPMTQEEGSSISLIILPLRASSDLIAWRRRSRLLTLTAPLRWQANLCRKGSPQVHWLPHAELACSSAATLSPLGDLWRQDRLSALPAQELPCPMVSAHAHSLFK